MSEPRLPFDESLLSGYVDGELTQAEEQRVRVYLEDHPAARAQVEEMQRLRTATLGTGFHFPGDTQWSELPRGKASSLARTLGWAALVASSLSVVGSGFWYLATSPHGLLPKLVGLGAVSGFLLLFLSVLIDRLRTLGSDRYRRVQK